MKTLISISILLNSLLSFGQNEARLSHIEEMQRQIANELNLKTVFTDAGAESLMYEFWNDSEELIMIGSRYTPTFYWVNDATCKYLGYTRQELTSVSFYKLVHPRDLERTKAAFNKFKATGKIGFNTDYFENRYRHKNGYYLPIYWSSIIITDRDLFLMQASKEIPTP